jgi:formylglycine-generating enzyme required for sulfatase activity
MKIVCTVLFAVAMPFSALPADNLPKPFAVRWTNSLNMVFVKVPDTSVAFCIWETRIQDYAVFVREGHWARLWPLKADFAQETNHPIVNVSWADARAFCVWLTKREQDKGLLALTQVYRLPTDREWSAAVGLPHEKGRTAEARMAGSSSHYPWGLARIRTEVKGGGGFTPEIPKHAGNYIGDPDGFKFTAPVGSFAPNKLGIFDLGGNVWEWCYDFADDGRRNILRGGSWYGAAVTSATRDFTLPDGEVGNFGFRCVRADSPASLD